MGSCSGSSTFSRYAVMSVTSIGGAWGGGGGGVPVERLPRDVGRVTLEECPILGGALASFVSGVVAPQGVGQVRPGCPFAGWGPQGALCRESARSGSAGSFGMGSGLGGV